MKNTQTILINIQFNSETSRERKSQPTASETEKPMDKVQSSVSMEQRE